MDKNNELAAAGGVVKSKDEVPEKNSTADQQESKHLVTLSKPYPFEDEGNIESIDLSCLENATAETLVKVSKIMTSTGDVMALPENDIRYAFYIAAECTGYPYSFFKKLNLCDATKIKRGVINFLHGVESA